MSEFFFFLKNMTIEIVWQNISDNSIFDIVDLSNFILWLLTMISKTPELEKNNGINGYILLNDEKANCGALLFINNKKSQKKILEILQQPPGEFKGKYIACVPCDEPSPVLEQKTLNSDEESMSET